MARPPRSLLDDGCFHAYSRGTGPIRIYRDRDDYDRFALMLRRTARRFGWQLLAWCLMPTHYHLLLEAPVDQLSAGMHWLNGAYAQGFNRRHGRVGHLFQSRFQVRAIEEEDYLERVAAYVIENPVRAGHCNSPAEWPWTWSSYGPLADA